MVQKRSIPKAEATGAPSTRRVHQPQPAISENSVQSDSGLRKNIPVYALPRIKGSTAYGAFDVLRRHNGIVLAVGWAFDSEQLEMPLEVAVRSGDRLVGGGVANIPRPDLVSAGAPRDSVGFSIPLRLSGLEKKIQIDVEVHGVVHTLREVELGETMFSGPLRREDVISTFRLLFQRDPESEDAIDYQMSVHASKTSLFNALFKSPEFLNKNLDLIALLQNRSAGSSK